MSSLSAWVQLWAETHSLRDFNFIKNWCHMFASLSSCHCILNSLISDFCFFWHLSDGSFHRDVGAPKSRQATQVFISRATEIKDWGGRMEKAGKRIHGGDAGGEVRSVSRQAEVPFTRTFRAFQCEKRPACTARPVAEKTWTQMN